MEGGRVPPRASGSVSGVRSWQPHRSRRASRRWTSLPSPGPIRRQRDACGRQTEMKSLLMSEPLGSSGLGAVGFPETEAGLEGLGVWAEHSDKCVFCPSRMDFK